MSNKYVIVFDLDDTLYKEIDFLKSAYTEIASFVDKKKSQEVYNEMLSNYYSKKNVFEILSRKYPEFSVRFLLKFYREHFPAISLSEEDKKVLSILRKKGNTGLITDGRHYTQQNKIKALGLEHFFDKVIISEVFGVSKPASILFEQFLIFGNGQYYYIANDTSKDFIVPNQLGWTSICLLDLKNQNISPQNFSLEESRLPQIKINSMNDLLDIII